MTDFCEHYCEYDHGLHEPCGKPASLRLINMWLCPEHYDATMAFFDSVGVDPFDPAPPEETLLDDEEL